MRMRLWADGFATFCGKQCEPEDLGPPHEVFAERFDTLERVGWGNPGQSRRVVGREGWGIEAKALVFNKINWSRE